MDFSHLQKLAKKTRTCHSFESGQVLPQEILHKCIELALMAPNHRFTFPWQIIEVQNEKRLALANLSEAMAKDKGGSDETLEKARSKVLNPSGLLVFLLPKKPNNDFEEREDYATLSCSIQLLALALQSEGWHYKWSTGGLTRHQRTYEILQVDSSQEEIVGFIWIGKAKKLPIYRERPELGKILRH